MFRNTGCFRNETAFRLKISACSVIMPAPALAEQGAAVQDKIKQTFRIRFLQSCSGGENHQFQSGRKLPAVADNPVGNGGSCQCPAPGTERAFMQIFRKLKRFVKRLRMEAPVQSRFRRNSQFITQSAVLLQKKKEVLIRGNPTDRCRRQLHRRRNFIMVSVFNGGSSGCIGAKRKFRIRRSRNGIQMNLIRLSRLRCLMKQGQCGKRVRQFRFAGNENSMFQCLK